MSRGHSIIMRTDATRERALHLITSLPVNLDKPLWQVIIKPYKKNRSLDQNNLLHMWIQAVANETGNDLETVKEYLRARYLSPVSREWKEPVTGKVSIVEAPRSTTTLTVQEMTDFLNNIQQFALDNGIALPHPEDLIWAIQERAA